MKSHTCSFSFSSVFIIACALISPATVFAGGRRTSMASRKGRLYLSWGYNRSAYTPSDIRFTGPDYDFTLHGVTAKDRPTKFSANTYFNPTNATIPQYEFRISYFIGERTSLSFGISHLKYVVTQGQGTNISGFIDTSASQRFSGNYDFDPFTIDPRFLRFEHTNGLNYESVEIEALFLVLENLRQTRGLYLTTAVGLGVVTPKSDVTLFNARQENEIHLAGYGVNGKLGLRFEFLNKFFVKGFTNFGYINLPSVLTRSGGTGDRASQHLYFIEGSGILGVSFHTFN